MLRPLIAVTILALGETIQAAEPPIAVAELARITGYPASKIIVEDGTRKANRQAARKNRPQCLSYHFYHSSQDDTFASISIAIGKRGTALTPELDAKFSKTIRDPNYSGPLRALTLNAEMTGYSGIGMAGGGGSMYRSVVSLPNYDRDIEVTVSLGEEGLTPLAGAEAYRDTVLTLEGVNRIIEKCIAVTANNVIASVNSGRATEPPQVLTENPQQSPLLLPRPTAPSESPIVMPQPKTTGSDSTAWIWVVGVLFLVALVLLANAIRNRRR